MYVEQPDKDVVTAGAIYCRKYLVKGPVINNELGFLFGIIYIS